jgi:galactitol-specific phosphotransferase system IIB component
MVILRKKQAIIQITGGIILKDIAVEKSLSNISDYLKDHGYKVYEIDATQTNNKDFIRGFDAVVISGINKDFLGIQDTTTEMPVIIASGLKPEEVIAGIEKK